jgi:hypothetical protein
MVFKFWIVHYLRFRNFSFLHSAENIIFGVGFRTQVEIIIFYVSFLNSNL